MYNSDYIVIAATVAVLMLAYASTYLHLRWHLYELFLGKRLAYPAHIGLMTIVVAELAFAVGADTMFGRGGFRVPAIGVVGIASGVWLLVAAVRQSGISVVTHGYIFGKGKQKLKGKLARSKDPAALAYALLLVGVGLLSGRPVLLLCAVAIYIGGVLLVTIEQWLLRNFKLNH